jgi:23S rRNA (adenine2030-N6)-methyltransferase
VLIDPPFEQKDEMTRLADALIAAHGKWRGGVLLGWYPIKEMREVAAFLRRLSQAKFENSLRIELVCDAIDSTRLRGTGLICVNPPFTLRDEAQILLPALAKVFWPKAAASYHVEPLAR